MLSVTGLTCLRGDRTVLRDLSFILAPGNAILVRGANGAGKSTLLRALAGLLRPVSGTIALNGYTQDEDMADYRRNLCWLGHQDAAKPSETVEQSIHLRSRLHGATYSEASLLALDLVALRHRPMRELSEGQKRRAALAGVIASGAALWLLDEPATALDAASAELFHAALDKHLATGGMAVIATHDTHRIQGALELCL